MKTKLNVAKCYQNKLYELTYINKDNYLQTLKTSDAQSFFAIIELLHACGRKYEYKIIDNSYWSIN